MDFDCNLKQITANLLAVKGIVKYTPVPRTSMEPKEKNSQHLLPLLGGTLILITFILAAGCAGQGSESRVNGTGWFLTGYVQNGTTIPALAGIDVTLAFGNDGRIAGLAGCNRYFATYQDKGTTITIGQVGSTMMYCGQPGVMEQESAYLTLLSQVTTFTQEGGRLSLYNAKGTKILAFTKTIPPEPKPLVGTNWTLESVHTGNAVSSGITGTTITAVFDDDNRISGSAGCNRYIAHYDVTSTSLSISETGLTKMMCGIPGVMNQESTYVNLLKTTRSYTIEGNQLALLEKSGVRILTFRANS